MEIINKNPYRYLGVYSNTPTKERIANKGRINAFLKVGKHIDFQLDFPNLLPSIERTTETIYNAESQLSLPSEQLRYAQFWWINITSVDKTAFQYLIEGDFTRAKQEWEREDNFSSLQNRIVLALINNEINTAINCAEKLYKDHSKDFETAILGDQTTSTQSWQTFLNALLEQGISIPNELSINSEWKQYISDKEISSIIERIAKAVDKSKATRNKHAGNRLEVGKELIESTKSELRQLKTNLAPTDVRFQTIADKLANEILQCGIDYYNESDNEYRAEESQELQKYAYTTAKGNLTKERCKDNIETLQKIINNLPPAVVRHEFYIIKERLRKASTAQNSIKQSMVLLNDCRPYLIKIRKALGYKNAVYLQQSTQVVSFALQTIINELHIAEEEAKYSSKYDNKIDELKQALKDALDAIKLMKTFHMDIAFRNNKYSGCRNYIIALCNNYGIHTVIEPPTPPKEKGLDLTFFFLSTFFGCGFGVLAFGADLFVLGIALGVLTGIIGTYFINRND